MDKQALRKQYLDKRKALSYQEWQAACDSLFDQVKANKELIGRGPVHIFLPIEKFKEVDTWPIIRWLWREGIRTMTSLTDIEQGTLSHVWFDDKTHFNTSKWGIPEPVYTPPADPSLCTVIFVPLLVADKHGNRIGYGKGFYDGFLSSISPATGKVGLSLLPILEEIHEAEQHDVKLDMVLAPERN
ncbi:MAG: 5-formyltetrahydrofolate cyclo-ligase [Imperialibacter sp.]|uniref:5-formyltetrahydrofolate cyclo-ligase n=1 Tax=Imperialibacter sp. TaxID=2038411 RepID=UPI0032EE743E